MPMFGAVGGSVVTLNPKVNIASAQRQIASVHVCENGIWKRVFRNEIVVTFASAEQVDVSTLFTPSDWAADVPKRVIIPSDATIGSTSVSVPALKAPAGFGGALVIENYGKIYGAGGAANSGVGGDAFEGPSSGPNVVLLNFGEIRSGGGGGGKGGTGGGGQYNYNYREPSSGWNFVNNNSASMYMWMNFYDTDEDDNRDGYDRTAILWSRNTNNPNYQPVLSDAASSYSAGGWTYLKGPVYWTSESQDRRGIARQQTRTATTDGGAGGNGGVGQGYNKARTTGSAGSAGGTNAGNGGTGGTGAVWGSTGNTGSTGANGNRTNGLAGIAGGLPGYALLNAGFIDLTDQGTISGRV